MVRAPHLARSPFHTLLVLVIGTAVVLAVGLAASAWCREDAFQRWTRSALVLLLSGLVGFCGLFAIDLIFALGAFTPIMPAHLAAILIALVTYLTIQAVRWAVRTVHPNRWDER